MAMNNIAKPTPTVMNNIAKPTTVMSNIAKTTFDPLWSSAVFPWLHATPWLLNNSGMTNTPKPS